MTSKPTLHIEPLAYSEATAALVCAVGITTFSAWIKLGLPYIHKGDRDGRKHKIFLRTDLERWLQSRRNGESTNGGTQ